MAEPFVLDPTALSRRLVFPDAELTTAQLDNAVRRFATLLDSRATVVLGAANRSGTLISWLGTLVAGGRTILVNPQLPPLAAERIVPLDRSSIYVGDANWLDRHAPCEARRLCLEEVEQGTDGTGSSMLPWSLTGSTVMLTSGTTGGSKAVLWSWPALRHGAETMAMVGRYDRDDVVMTALPMFHANASIVVIMAALISGSDIAVAPKFSARGFSAMARDFDATKTSLLGSMAMLLLDRDVAPYVALRRAIIAPCDPVTARALRDRYGCSVAQIYGQTDIGICLWNDDATIGGGCGRPLPGWEARVDAVTGASAGGSGELLIRPLLAGVCADGYLGDPELTVATRRDFWFHTGDSFAEAPEGLYYRGRLKDVIRTRGENVNCAEVEQVLREAAAEVREVAIVGIPNRMGEDDVIAIVEAGCPVEQLLKSLRPGVIGNLPSYARPQGLAIVDELPRTATHKVSKASIDLNGLHVYRIDWNVGLVASDHYAR